MYEPYPYQIKKGKIFSLLIITLVLIGVAIFLYSKQNLILVDAQDISTLIYIIYLFEVALILFCIKAYLLKYSRDYLYIGVGAFLVLLIQLFKRFGISALKLTTPSGMGFQSTPHIRLRRRRQSNIQAKGRLLLPTLLK